MKGRKDERKNRWKEEQIKGRTDERRTDERMNRWKEE